jgi:Glu-tRNA(Gln) amidotransferase subunit E-like FAD-binding protein
MSDLDRLEAAMSECREMIREAHAATKDLRTAVREAKKELRELAKDEVAGQVHSDVTRQLDEVRERTSEAVTAAAQKVIAEFDRLGNRCWATKHIGKRRVVDARPDVPRPMWLNSRSRRMMTPGSLLR